MTGAILQAVNVFSSSQSTGGTLVGTIQGNHIGTSTAHSASTQGGGLRVEIQGHTDATVLIDSNVIQGYDGDDRGIDVEDPGPVNTSGPNVTSDVSPITNNTVTPGASPAASIGGDFFGADNQSGSDATAQTLRAVSAGNTVPSATVNGDFLPGQLQFFLFTGTNADGEKGQLVGTAGTAAAQLAATNTGSTSASAGITVISGQIGTPPLLFDPNGGVQPADPSANTPPSDPGDPSPGGAPAPSPISTQPTNGPSADPGAGDRGLGGDGADGRAGDVSARRHGWHRRPRRRHLGGGEHRPRHARRQCRGQRLVYRPDAGRQRRVPQCGERDRVVDHCRSGAGGPCRPADHRRARAGSRAWPQRHLRPGEPRQPDVRHYRRRRAAAAGGGRGERRRSGRHRRPRLCARSGRAWHLAGGQVGDGQLPGHGRPAGQPADRQPAKPRHGVVERGSRRRPIPTRSRPRSTLLPSAT